MHAFIAVFTPSAGLTIIGTILGLLVTVGGLIAVVRSGLARATIDSQEKEIASLRRRVEGLESENNEARKRITRTETEVKLWREAATGTNVAKELERFADESRRARENEHSMHVKIAEALAAASGRRAQTTRTPRRTTR